MKLRDKELKSLAKDMYKRCNNIISCYEPPCKYRIYCDKMRHTPIYYLERELAEALRSAGL